ncbi:MAG: biopolymer transporter ExbD [Oscillatoria sp. Prado101]|jgi:biopolymer transport protein ExbD|nr:biopolymer transporter ExbD [Oscillatoria sp. Prado101]
MKIHLDSSAEEARIEIIPLIDVIFCILTFFILAALQLTRQQAITVDLPKASTGQPQVRQMLLVSVSALGQVYVEQTLVSSADQLTQAVRDYRAQNPTGLMVLYASKDARYNDVVQVLDKMREVGGDRVALATLPGAEVKPTGSNPQMPVIPGVPNLTLPSSVSPAVPLNPSGVPKSGTTFDPGKMQVPVVPGQVPASPAPAVPAPAVPAPAVPAPAVPAPAVPAPGIPAPPAGAGGSASGAQ